MVRNLPANAGDADLIHGSGRSRGVGNGNTSSRLGNPMNREACGAIVHGVTKSQTELSTAHACRVHTGGHIGFRWNWPSDQMRM